MHDMIRKIIPAVAMAAFFLCTAFPAYADEPVGTNVTVVEVAESSSSKDSGSDSPAIQAGKPADPAVSRPLDEEYMNAHPSDEEYVDAGPGAQRKEEVPEPEEVSLGRFRITGYCGCDLCSSGHGLTYSGTVPKPNHTISADLDRFPLGTRLKIDGTVYTVEDKGSSVVGDILDIYYNSHEEAVGKGTYTAEVFLIEDTAEE